MDNVPVNDSSEPGGGDVGACLSQGGFLILLCEQTLPYYI